MKKLLAVAMMIAFAASAAYAGAPDSVTLKGATKDPVSFNHKKHSADPASCKGCHGEGAPAKLTLDKAKGHELCMGCHKTKKAGPTKCGECHKK